MLKDSLRKEMKKTNLSSVLSNTVNAIWLVLKGS